MEQKKSDEDQLEKLCKKDPVVSSICQYFGTRTRLRDVTVDLILAVVEKACEDGPRDRYDVVRALKEIAKVSDKFGKFLAGRHKAPSRYKLTQAIIEFGKNHLEPSKEMEMRKVAQEEEAKEAKEEADHKEDDDDWFEHIIRIRDGVQIKLRLPKDLSQAEAKKLANIVENLYG